jgi:hypothetical protein
MRHHRAQRDHIAALVSGFAGFGLVAQCRGVVGQGDDLLIGQGRRP